MDFKSILTSIKVLLANATEEKTEEVKATEAKLKDGTLVSYESLEVGKVVSTIETDATLKTLAAGDYELEDGSTFTVDADGVITASVIKVVEEEKKEEEKVEEVKASAMESKLADGTVISYEWLGVNQIVNAVGTDGTLTPLAAGDYTMNATTTTYVSKFSIGEGGIVTKMENGYIESVAASMKLELSAANDKVAKLEKALELVVGMFEQAEPQLTALEAIETRLAAIENEAAADPTHLSKVKDEPNTFASRLAGYKKLTGKE